MFTPKATGPLALVFLLASGISGCGQPSLDSPEYGEIIEEVPPELNRPYPLPELEPPKESPLPGPAEEPGESAGNSE
jgi:hypothetical protein